MITKRSHTKTIKFLQLHKQSLLCVSSPVDLKISNANGSTNLILYACGREHQIRFHEKIFPVRKILKKNLAFEKNPETFFLKICTCTPPPTGIIQNPSKTS